MAEIFDGVIWWESLCELVEFGKKAKEHGIIKGILLHQGESNNGQADWPEKVEKIYRDLLCDFGP